VKNDVSAVSECRIALSPLHSTNGGSCIGWLNFIIVVEVRIGFERLQIGLIEAVCAPGLSCSAG